MDNSMKEQYAHVVGWPLSPSAQYNSRETIKSWGLQEKADGKIILFGCGGHARSIVNTLREINGGIEILLVDENAGCDETILGCRTEQEYKLKGNDRYIIAIGNNAKRRELYNRLADNHAGCCISIVSVYARLGIGLKIGKGTFIASSTYIGPEVEIGNNTIINTGSVIEHETKIGDNAHIAPHATICGRVRIGNNVFCGAGSIVVDNVNICDDVIIGAGAVVKADIRNPGTYVGVPAKKIS